MIRPSQFGKRWPVVPLAEVVDFLDNLRRPVTDCNRTAGAYPYYGANGIQGTIDGYLFDEPLILVAEDGGHFGSRDKTIAYQVRGKCWVNNHAHVLRPKPNADINYLTRTLEQYDVTPLVTGTTRGKLTKGAASRIEIPLPPLEEQKLIAAILDKADLIRRKRQQALRLTDDFLRSVFLEMFGDPVTNSREWPTDSLKNLGAVSTGSTPPSAGLGMFGGSIPFVTPGDLKEGWTGTARTVTELGASKVRTVRKGATLVCCIGATIGKMGKASALSAFNQQINAVEWNDRVDDDFGLELMRFFKALIANRGSSTTLPILNKSGFQSIEVPVPPIERQKQFAAIVRKLEKTRDNLIHSATEADNIFASLQQRAFSGQL